MGDTACFSEWGDRLTVGVPPPPRCLRSTGTKRPHGLAGLSWQTPFGGTLPQAKGFGGPPPTPTVAPAQACKQHVAWSCFLVLFALPSSGLWFLGSLKAIRSWIFLLLAAQQPCRPSVSGYSQSPRHEVSPPHVSGAPSPPENSDSALSLLCEM